MVRKRRFWFFIGIISLLLILLNIPLVSVLAIKSEDGSKLLYFTLLQPKEPFYIQYTHSIHLTPVLEKYYMNEKMQIVVDSVTYESYGVGMPSDVEENQKFTQKDGKLIISNINRKLPFFEQRIGQVIANHKFIVHGAEIPLAEIGPPGSAVRFQADKLSLFHLWRRGYLEWLIK